MTQTRRLLYGLFGLVGVLALVYAADLATTRDRLPRGVRVAGVAIGGRSVAEARRIVATRVTGPKTVTVSGPAGVAPLTLDPAAAGLRIDPAKTVAHARGQALNPIARIAAMFHTTDVAPVASVDEAALRRAVRAWAAKTDRSMREGTVRFDGATPVAVLPRNGVAIDVDRTVAAIADAYPKSDHVAATATVTRATTTASAVTHALEEVAKPAVAARFVLHAQKGDAVLTPTAIAGMLRFAPKGDGAVTVSVDRKAFDAALDTVLPPVETPAKDAPITVDDAGKISIGESALGKKVDRDVLFKPLLSLLQQPAPRSVDLVLVDAEPRVSTALAKTLGIKEMVSEFTTHHPCCRARVTNIHRIADIVNGAVVLPGETFSLNGYVGERDAKRGFVMAPMILDGKFVPAVGGGVSQFATTMFNAVFFGGFVDVYHKPHSYYISRYPPGREATVSTPSPDLKWKNDSPYGVLITTAYTDKSVTVRFWSTKRYDIEAIAGARYRPKPFRTVYDSRPTCESSSGENGFDIDVWRVFTVAGKEVKREKFHTRYLPEPHFVCR